jgi:hypothetical protein
MKRTKFRDIHKNLGLISRILERREKQRKLSCLLLGLQHGFTPVHKRFLRMLEIVFIGGS